MFSRRYLHIFAHIIDTISHIIADFIYHFADLNKTIFILPYQQPEVVGSSPTVSSTTNHYTASDCGFFIFRQHPQKRLPSTWAEIRLSTQPDRRRPDTQFYERSPRREEGERPTKSTSESGLLWMTGDSPEDLILSIYRFGQSFRILTNGFILCLGSP